MQCHDYEISERIAPDTGVGMEFVSDGIRYVAFPREDNKVTFEISSWVGLSPGAKHRYCSMSVSGLPIGVVGASKPAHGSMGGPDVPKEVGYIHIELTRVWSVKELLEDANELELRAWEIRQIRGDKRQRTKRFNSESTVRRHLKAEFKRIFGEGWVLVNRYP